MSDLRVVIRGLAFCRPLEGTNMTQILFPHPPGHALSLTITKFHTGSPSEVIEDKFPSVNSLALTIENDTAATLPLDGHGTPLNTNLVDIIQLHKDFAGPGSRINFRPRGDVAVPMSFFTLPTNVLYADGNAAIHEFWMRKTRGGTSPERIYLKRPDGMAPGQTGPTGSRGPFSYSGPGRGRPGIVRKITIEKTVRSFIYV